MNGVIVVFVGVYVHVIAPHEPHESDLGLQMGWAQETWVVAWIS